MNLETDIVVPGKRGRHELWGEERGRLPEAHHRSRQSSYDEPLSDVQLYDATGSQVPGGFSPDLQKDNDGSQEGIYRCPKAIHDCLLSNADFSEPDNAHRREDLPDHHERGEIGKDNLRKDPWNPCHDSWHIERENITAFSPDNETNSLGEENRRATPTATVADPPESDTPSTATLGPADCECAV